MRTAKLDRGFPSLLLPRHPRIGQSLFFVVLTVLILLSLPLPAQSPPQYLQRGREALREGIPLFDRELLLQGADAFRRALAGNPRYAEARVGLAEALLWLGDYAQSEEQIQRARELRYDRVDLDLLEARLLVLTDRIDAARETYRRVLQQQPYNVDAQVGNAILALSGGTSENLMERLRVLERRFPENRQLLTALVELSWARGNRTEGESYLAAALQYHGDVPSVQLVAARWALENEDPERAEYHARNSVTLAPTLQDGWLLLAHAAYLRGAPAEARTHYEQLITLQPENVRAWYARGQLAVDTGETETAYSSWERALRIQPDYELARIAHENTLVRREPLESPLRSVAAERYRRTGRELERRFFHWQAERHYRRGLQINPFDTELRRSLADLYLGQERYGRYLQELEVIAGIQEPDRDLSDRIETFRRLREDALATRWNVDQFTASRDRTKLAIYYRQDPDTLEPAAARHTAEYLASLLQTSQNTTIVEVSRLESDRIRSIARARDNDAERVLVLDVSLPPDRVHLAAELIDPSTGNTRMSRSVIRDGSGRLETAVRDLASLVLQEIPSRGTVLNRRFETILVSIGAVDGLEQGDTVVFRDKPDGVELGNGTVTALDDLLAEVSFVPEGPDTLVAGHTVQRLEERDPERAPVAARPAEERRSQMLELMKRIFRLP